MNYIMIIIKAYNIKYIIYDWYKLTKQSDIWIKIDTGHIVSVKLVIKLSISRFGKVSDKSCSRSIRQLILLYAKKENPCR